MEGLAVTVIGSLIIFGLFIVVFFGDNAAKKRKSEQRPKTPLERYFSFDEREFNVNSFLKSTMNAEGSSTTGMRACPSFRHLRRVF